MNEKNCRLCLNTVNDNYQVIEEVSRRILAKLSLNLNFDISNEAVMCYECMNNLQVLYNFKSIDSKNRYGDEFNNTNVDSVGSSEQQQKCYFCKKTSEHKALLFLNESKENMFLMDIIRKYFSEWNLNNIKECLTCQNCLEALQRALTFITNCFAVEENIKRYIEVEGVDVNGQIELNNVLQYKLKLLTKYEAGYSDFIKIEERNNEQGKDITVESEPKIGNDEELVNPELNIKPEEIDVLLKQDDCERFQRISTEIPMSKGEVSSFQSNSVTTPCEISLGKDMLSHKIAPVQVYKCKLCSYVSKYRHNFKRHLSVHKNPSVITMYKCKMCIYETIYKAHIEEHILIHKSLSSEVEMFKTTKQYLHQHMGIQCELCPYKTNQKEHLQRHMVRHKNPWEVTMYKCEMCTYETKYRNALSSHMLKHKNASEIKMHQCIMCIYETKRKGDLKRHMLIHSPSPSKITIYKCETHKKHKNRVNWHVPTHKNPSEITLYQCAVCTYKARCKENVQQHMLIHESPLEITMFI